MKGHLKMTSLKLWDSSITPITLAFRWCCYNTIFLSWWYRVFHRFMQAKFDYGSLILSLSQFMLLALLPQKCSLVHSKLSKSTKNNRLANNYLNPWNSLESKICVCFHRYKIHLKPIFIIIGLEGLKYAFSFKIKCHIF